MTGCLGSWQSAIGAVELPILVLSIGRIVGEKSQFHQLPLGTAIRTRGNDRDFYRRFEALQSA